MELCYLQILNRCYIAVLGFSILLNTKSFASKLIRIANIALNGMNQIADFINLAEPKSKK